MGKASARFLADGRFDEAEACLAEALRLEPYSSELLALAVRHYLATNEESLVLEFAGRLHRAIPESVEALFQLGAAAMMAGEFETAEQTFESALKLQAENSAARSTWLHLTLFRTDGTPGDELIRHAEFGPRGVGHVSEYPGAKPWRIGILSGEFERGSSRFFLPGVLRKLRQAGYEVRGYLSRPGGIWTGAPSEAAFDECVNVHGWDAEQIAERIQRDGIGILLEVSGHLAHNRLDAIARKPAPVSVALPRYPCTLGMEAVEYRFTDRWADPPGETESHYTEKLIRLPHGYLAYEAPSFAPEVTALPADSNGYVTFGFFQSPLKINAGVLDILAESLGRTAGSRLLVHYAIHDFDRPGRKAREWIADALVERGVARERIDFKGPLDLAEHLALLREVDIALDSFPYSGQTTTCECLWMGVPVVTFSGDRFASRVSAAILHRSGLSDWVAKTHKEYTDIATRKGADLAELRALRAGLRRQFAESPVCDSALVAREMGEALRELWRNWRDSQKSTS